MSRQAQNAPEYAELLVVLLDRKSPQTLGPAVRCYQAKVLLFLALCLTGRPLMAISASRDIGTERDSMLSAEVSFRNFDRWHGNVYWSNCLQCLRRPD